MTITEQIRAAIEAEIDSGRRTQYRLAHDAGIHETVLSRFRRGATPRSETLDRLCETLGLTLQGPDGQPVKAQKRTSKRQRKE